MNSSDDETNKAVLQLIDAIKKHGTVSQYNYRPILDCFAAGFLYTFGGISALTAIFLIYIVVGLFS